MTSETLCEEQSYTVSWYEEKNESKTRMTFSAQKQNSSLKKQLFGWTVYKICMFRCEVTILLWKWLKMDVGKSKIVWSGNNTHRLWVV